MRQKRHANKQTHTLTNRKTGKQIDMDIDRRGNLTDRKVNRCNDRENRQT